MSSILWALLAFVVLASASNGPTGVLDVQLLTPDGKPAAHQRVCIRESSIYHLAHANSVEVGESGLPRQGLFSGGKRNTAWMETDANGVVRIEREVTKPADRDRAERRRRLLWTTSFWIPESGASAPTTFILDPNEPTREEVSLVPSATLRGRVLDERGAPRSDVAVEASLGDPSRPMRPSWSLVSRTDAEGNYRFDGLVPARYDLNASSSDGFQVVTDTHPGSIDITSAGDVFSPILFVQDRALRVRLVDDSGFAIRDSMVNYQAWRGHGYVGRGQETDSDGWFELDFARAFDPPRPHSGPPCLPGAVTLWVLNWRNDVPSSRKVPRLSAGGVTFDLTRPFSSEVEISMVETGAVLADARAPTGENIRNATVYFFGLGAASKGDPDFSSSAWLDQPDRLDLPCSNGQDWPRVVGVPAGEYELYIRSAENGAWATVAGSRRIVVEAGKTTELDRMVLRSK